MHRVGLLLICVSAVYAHRLYNPMFPLTPFDLNKLPFPQRPVVSEPEDIQQNPRIPYNPYYPYTNEHHNHEYHINNLREYPEQGITTLDKAQLTPLVKRPVPSVNKPWAALPYQKSLQDLEEGIARLKSHLTPDAFVDKENKNFRYIVMVHVVSQLSKEVATNGWQSYNQHYEDLVKRYIDEAVMNPQNKIKILECSTLQPILRAIKEAQQVIHHPVVQFICKAQPSACDAVIFAIIHTSPSHRAKKNAADALLAAGNAASIFLSSFASTFDAISGQNAYDYLLQAREELRPLVAADAHARIVIKPNGDPSCSRLASYPLPPYAPLLTPEVRRYEYF